MFGKTPKTTRGAWRLPAMAAGLTLSATAAALAAPAAPSHDVRPASGWSSVIVQTAGPLTPVQSARVAALGGDVTRHLTLIQSLAVRVPTRNLAKMAALPFVSHVSPDGITHKCDEFIVASSEAGEAYRQYGLTGQGVTVAVIDSGLAASPDLTGGGRQVVKGPDYSGGVTGVTDGTKTDGTKTDGPQAPATKPDGTKWNPDDPCGHGTHVAGIIGGNGKQTTGKNNFRHFYGIAPQAGIVSVRVLDQNGKTNVSNAIAGLQWVVTNQAKYGIRVVNLSLGHPVTESYRTDPLCRAVEAAYRSGLVVIVAAGNAGRAHGSVCVSSDTNEGWGTAYGSIQSPANDPCVITVGATKDGNGNRSHDKIATYSSRGPSRMDLVLKPDIIAPGNRVISLDAPGSVLDTYDGGTNTIPQSLYKNTKDATQSSRAYFRLSGTSMAAPVVVGAVALLLQANPSLTPDTVKARLMLSADKWADPTGSADPLTYGAGYLNISAALASTAVAALPALSPTLTQNTDGSVSLVMDRAAWGTTTTYGSRAAWGTGLWGTGITDMRAAWGTSITFAPGVAADRAAWGTNTLAADRAAWGTSSVWSDRAAWGTSATDVDLTSTALQGE